MTPKNKANIKSLDLQSKDWKKRLAQILDNSGLGDAYYSLSQSLLREGQNEEDNLFLYYILNLPNNVSNKNVSASFYSTLSNLIDQNLINKTDSYLTQRDFYNEGPEDTLYKLKLMAFIKDKRQLSKFGNPKDLDKKAFFNGSSPKSASEMKEILHSWQTKSGDEEDEDEDTLTGKQIMQEGLGLEDYESVGQFKQIYSYVKNNVKDRKLIDFFDSKEIRAKIFKLTSSETFRKKLNRWLDDTEYPNTEEGKIKFNRDLAKYISNY